MALLGSEQRPYQTEVTPRVLRSGTTSESQRSPPIARALDETVRKPRAKILCPTSLVFARPARKNQEGTPWVTPTAFRLDTSVLSRAMRRDPAVLAHASQHPPGDLLLVTPVAAKIGFGLERLPIESRRRHLLTSEFQRWRRVLRWQDWGESAAEMFGQQKAALEARGALIDDWDIAIGASAIVHDASVATCNPRHFARLTGLHVVDWSRMPRRSRSSSGS